MIDLSQKTDEEVVEMTRKQNKEYYSQIIRRYQAKLPRYADSLVHDDHFCADIVQGSFIKAFINPNGFNTVKKFSSWIYRIVHNEAINTIKKKGWNN